MSQDEQNENFQTSETHNLSFKATELTEGDFSHFSQSMEISISKQNEQNESQTEGTLNERKRPLELEKEIIPENTENFPAKQSKLDLTEQNAFQVESDDIDDIENISSGLKLLNMYL